ncbi:MAG: WbqC family protein [Flavobacteriales bacterium]
MITLLPSCCLPAVGWFALYNQFPQAEIDVFEHFPKQTYRNRFDILGPNGRMTLTIPLESRKGEKIPTKDVRIAHGKWINGHLTSIRSAYGRSAFFEHYFEDIETLFKGKQTFLVDFNEASLAFFSKYMISKRVENRIDPGYSADPNDYADKRSYFEPGFKWPQLRPYTQVFSDRFPFENNLSALDLLFNHGPRAVDYTLLIKNGDGH